MKCILLSADGVETLIGYAIALLLSWAVFYFTVKAAVKTGTAEAISESRLPKTRKAGKVADATPNPAQKKLQAQYDKGQLTFVEYQAQWETLKS